MAKSGKGGNRQLELGPESERVLRALTEATKQLAALQQQAIRAAGGMPGGSRGLSGPTPGFSSPASGLAAPVQQIAALQLQQMLLQGLPPGFAPAADQPKRPPSAFQQAQKRLREESGIFANLGFGGIASTATRIGGAAEGLRELGFKGAGRFLTRAAIPLAIADQATQGVQTMALAAHDRYSTNAQIERRLFREFVPGGERIQSFVDALSGRAAGMEEADIQGRVRMAGVRERLDMLGFGLSHDPQQSGREALAAAFRGQRPALPPVIDRSTAAGEQQFRDEMKLLPFKQQRLKAERDLKQATAERLAIEQRGFDLAGRTNDLEREKFRIKKELERVESGPERQALLRRQEEINAESQGVNILRRQAAQQAADARARESVARGAVDQAKVREELLGRAEIVQGQADSARSGAVRLGLMTPLERQQAAAVVKMAKEHGLDALPPEWKAIVAQTAPQEFAKMAESAGAADPAFRSLQEQGIVDFPGKPGQSPSDLQREADQLRRDAGEKEFEIDSKTAAGVAAAGRDLGREIADLLQEFRKSVVDEIFREVRMGRNQ